VPERLRVQSGRSQLREIIASEFEHVAVRINNGFRCEDRAVLLDERLLTYEFSCAQRPGRLSDKHSGDMYVQIWNSTCARSLHREAICNIEVIVLASQDPSMLFRTVANFANTGRTHALAHPRTPGIRLVNAGYGVVVDSADAHRPF
jgi:hypothetical protein